jgi:hypothetical protein
MPQPEDLNSPKDPPTRRRKRRLQDVTHFAAEAAPAKALPIVQPWALQHYFDGEGDPIKELASRYPQVPMLSLFHTRQVGTRTPRGLATLATQDGAGSVIVEMDMLSQALQFTFVQNSMLALRFTLGALTELDTAQWLEGMRGDTGEAAFLWNETRWNSPYLISAAQKNFSTLFAFSPQQIEAAARLTPEVTRKLLDWLERGWNDSAQ